MNKNFNQFCVNDFLLKKLYKKLERGYLWKK